MTDWLVSLLILVLIVALFAAGMNCRRLPRPVWVVLFILPVVFWLLLRLASYVPSLAFGFAPVTWLFALRRPFLISAFIIAFAMGILIPQAPGRRLRVLLCILMFAGLIYHFAIPNIGPLLVRSPLRGIHSFMDGGICLQSTSWTCGAAASVTALHTLGIEADEGELAILSYTTPMFGTDETLLARAMEERYRSQYLTTDFGYYKSVRDLQGLCPALVSIHMSYSVDHLVTVLEVTDKTVVYGDPLKGLIIRPIEEFEEMWFNRALLVYRLQPAPNLVLASPRQPVRLLSS
jgi:predicted double-glycine peptidase